MLDVETTGLKGAVNAMTSIALVLMENPEVYLNHSVLKSGTIATVDDPLTMEWRKSKGICEQETLLPAIYDVEIPNLINNFVAETTDQTPAIIWAKPITFDWPFLARLYDEFGIESVFDYRSRMDVKSFIGGCLGHYDTTVIYDTVEFKGTPHKALDDCIWQIDCYNKAKEIGMQRLSQENNAI